MNQSAIRTVVLALVVVAITSCSTEEKIFQEESEFTFPSVQVETKTLNSFIELPARVEGLVESQIRAKGSGYITDLIVSEGQKVNKGDLLFNLESKSLSKSAKAAEANIRFRELELERLRKLLEAKVIGQTEVRKEEALLAKAKSEFQALNEEIDYLSVKSPVDGIVGDINFKVGNLVSSQDHLTTISQIETVHVYFALSEKLYQESINSESNQAVKFHEGDTVEFKLPNGKLYPENGIIESVSGEINKNTRTVTVKAKFPNELRILRNGGAGSILIRKQQKGLVIPSVSTLERQNKHFVFLIKEDGTVAEKPIKIKETYARYYLIESGLKEGQKILAKGFDNVEPGKKIKTSFHSQEEIAQSFQTVFK